MITIQSSGEQRLYDHPVLPLHAQTVIYCRNTCDKVCQMSTCNLFASVAH